MSDIVLRLDCGGIQSKKYKEYAAWVKDTWATKDENKELLRGKQHFLDNKRKKEWDALVDRFLREKDASARDAEHPEKWHPEHFNSDDELRRQCADAYLVQAMKKKRTHEKEGRTTTGPALKGKKRRAGADFEDEGKTRIHAPAYARDNWLVSLKGNKGKGKSKSGKEQEPTWLPTRFLGCEVWQYLDLIAHIRDHTGLRGSPVIVGYKKVSTKSLYFVLFTHIL